MLKRGRPGFTGVSVTWKPTVGIKPDPIDRDCSTEAAQKGDPRRLLVSGAYKTYSDQCYDDETGRHALMMSEDRNGDNVPWTYCLQMSADNECSGKTVAMNVQTKGEPTMSSITQIA